MWVLFRFHVTQEVIVNDDKEAGSFQLFSNPTLPSYHPFTWSLSKVYGKAGESSLRALGRHKPSPITYPYRALHPKEGEGSTGESWGSPLHATLNLGGEV